MNVFHVSCRNLQSLAVMLALVVCIYIALNLAYINFFNDLTLVENSEKSNAQSIAAYLKFGKPDANGKVEVLVSLDAEQLAQLLQNSDLSGLEQNKHSGGKVADNRIIIHNGSSHLPMNASYILYNPKLCDGLERSGLTWIVGIYSTPEQSARRKLLRETWANASLFRKNVFQTFFVMGRTSDAHQKSIQAEFDQYHDIVQGDFVDEFRNATLKGLLALNYVSHYCRAAKYFIKANDDTFVNIFSVMHLLQESLSHQHTVLCALWKENTMPILRDPAKCMQWCVAANELPGRTHFPQYCAGLAFALSRELVSALYSTSLSVPYFWIDDVYVTGLLMPEVTKKLHHINYIDLILNFTLSEEDVESEYLDSRKSLHYTFARVQTADTFRRLWKALFNRLPSSQFKLLSDAAIAQNI